MLYTHLSYHNDSIIVKKDAWRKDARRKTQEDFFTKIFTSHFIARVRKGCSRFAYERMLETEHNFIFWPHCYDRHVVSFLFSWCWDQLHRGFFRAPPRSGVAFPTTSGLYCLEVCWQQLWDPNSTELNNNSTPTRSPTGSLKSNV